MSLNIMASVRCSVVHFFGSRNSKITLAAKQAAKDPQGFASMAGKALRGVHNSPLRSDFATWELGAKIQSFALKPSAARAQDVFTQLYAVREVIRGYGDQVSDTGSAGSNNWYAFRACAYADQDIKAVKYFTANASQKGGKVMPMPTMYSPGAPPDSSAAKGRVGSHADAATRVAPPRSPPPTYATRDPFPFSRPSGPLSARAATDIFPASQLSAGQRQSGSV